LKKELNLNTLNTQQRKAVESLHGALLLLAGAGSGKTRVIIYRIANLIKHGIAPNNILAVTFTNKAACEMKERLQQLLTQKTAKAVNVGTFHSFCIKILRRYIYKLDYSTNFNLCSDAYQIGLLRNIMAELQCTGEGKIARDWLSTIGDAKNRMLSPNQLRKQEIPFANDIANVYQLYVRRMKQMDLLDFDDLLLLTIKLWQQYPEILQHHQKKYQYLLVDEYQDTNSVQLQIITMLAGKNANVCVVGDDDQSIYGWRGANLGNILKFESHFKKAQIIRLEQNYRSTKNILNVANHLISFNKKRHDKQLWSQQPDGKKLLAVRCEDANQEAKFVADYITEKLALDGGDYNQFAILFRSNSQSRLLEAHLRQSHIPYTMVGGNSFYERKEILDVISFLQCILSPKDDFSLIRIINVPPRNIGDKSIERLKQLQKITGLPLQTLLQDQTYLNSLPPTTANSVKIFKQIMQEHREKFKHPGNLYNKTEALLQDLEYIQGLGKMYKPKEDALRRKDNVMEFLDAIADFENKKFGKATLRQFMDSISLFDANDKEQLSDENAKTSVSLMTVHASKGLEFPAVIIVGLERGLFPHMRSLMENSIEEERRLFYVAITRAQKEVTMTYAERRRTKGQMMRQRPSKFLDELPEELITFTTSKVAIKPASKAVADDFIARMKAEFSK